MSSIRYPALLFGRAVIFIEFTLIFKALSKSYGSKCILPSTGTLLLITPLSAAIISMAGEIFPFASATVVKRKINKKEKKKIFFILPPQIFEYK